MVDCGVRSWQRLHVPASLTASRIRPFHSSGPGLSGARLPDWIDRRVTRAIGCAALLNGPSCGAWEQVFVPAAIARVLIEDRGEVNAVAQVKVPQGTRASWSRHPGLAR